MADQFNVLDRSTDYWETQALTSGESTIPRLLADNVASLAMTSQLLRLAFHTAKKTETITQVRVMTGTTAAGATPSLVRIGVYTVDTAGDLTLVASTANDTALLAGANTVYTKALSASFTKSAGQRYAFGLLVVTAAAAPTIVGALIPGSTEGGVAPRLNANVAAQADLPATVAAGSLAGTTGIIYGVVVP